MLIRGGRRVQLREGHSKNRYRSRYRRQRPAPFDPVVKVRISRDRQARWALIVGNLKSRVLREEIEGPCSNVAKQVRMNFKTR